MSFTKSLHLNGYFHQWYIYIYILRTLEKNLWEEIFLLFCWGWKWEKHSFEIFDIVEYMYNNYTFLKYKCKFNAEYYRGPCRNCPICFQVPIRARLDFPHVAAGGHMVWPGLEPHRIMIDKIILEFCVVVLILYSDYINIKMPEAKSTWRVQKYFFIKGNLKRKL